MKVKVKRLRLGVACACAAAAALLMGAADGSWLKRVPSSDRTQASPLADQAAAAAAGAHLYNQHCATCHGAEGLGKPGRPPVLSERVEHATDGELAWLLKNGNPWKGMPSWNALPTAQRWQLVAYLRTLNAPIAAPPTTPAQTQNPSQDPSSAQKPSLKPGRIPDQIPGQTSGQTPEKPQ